MGWKVSCVLIKPSSIITNEQVLLGFGFYNHRFVGNDELEEVLFPVDDIIHIGRTENTIVITHQQLAFELLDEKCNLDKYPIFRTFSDIKICTLVLHSVINYFGFSLIKERELKRLKTGDAENGTVSDFGRVLPEENDLLSRSFISEDGRRLYRLDEFPEELFTEDQVGENYVLNLFKKYTNKSISELYSLRMKGYSHF